MADSPRGYSYDSSSYGSYDSPESYQSRASPGDNYPSAQGAYKMDGTNPLTDTVAAQAMMRGPDPRLRHEYSQADPSGYQPPMVTGNKYHAPAVAYTPTSIPFRELLQAAEGSGAQFPLTTPAERAGYETAAYRTIDAGAQQHLAKTAWGSLEEIGDKFDPNNSKNVYARDTSVGAAFQVMEEGAKFNTARGNLVAAQSRREAEKRERERRADGSAPGEKRGRKSSSASAASQSSKHPAEKKKRNR